MLISAFGGAASGKHVQLVKLFAGNMESLAGATPEEMADEVEAHVADWPFDRTYDGLARTPLLVITPNDGSAPASDSLVAALRARGNQQVTAIHMETDHPYSDHRIALESAVLQWLEALGGALPAETRTRGDSAKARP